MKTKTSSNSDYRLCNTAAIITFTLLGALSLYGILLRGAHHHLLTLAVCLAMIYAASNELHKLSREDSEQEKKKDNQITHKNK